MKKKDWKKKREEKNYKNSIDSLNANDNRAASISIGSSGNGTTEIMIRGQYGGFMWNVYNPTQVVEMIHQLSASIGCNIHIQPRKDFASWREWNEPTKEELEHLRGWSPFPQLNDEITKLGMLKKEELLGFKKEELEDGMATAKTVNKRKLNGSNKKPS